MAELSVVGQSVTRVDAYDKVTGRTRYTADMKLPGMLYGKILRSPHARAKILRIDTSAAKKYPGVKTVATGKDAGTEKYGFLARERSILPLDMVNFMGEGVAAVAAETQEAADEAAALIKVEYEALPGVFDVEEAMKPNPAVAVHPDFAKYVRLPLPPPMLLKGIEGSPNIYAYRPVIKGDVEKGFKEADLVLENRFSTPRMHHGALEPLNALVRPESDGGFTIWAPLIMPFGVRSSVCGLFGLPPSKVRIIVPITGGSFGARTDAMQVAQAALLARMSGKPVKLVLSREEFLLDGGTREPLVVYIKDGVKKDGTLVARHIKAIVHAGAYCGLMAVVSRSLTYGASATYRVPNYKVDSYTVGTNEPPSMPFRGFGSTQVQWAIESQMDMLAAKLEMDPAEIRRKNILNEGEEDGVGMPVHSIGVRDCLDKVTRWIDWKKPAARIEGPWRTGKGIAINNRMVTGGTNSVVTVKIHEDGAIEIRHSVTDQGQGAHTVLTQIAAEEFKTTVDKVRLVNTDTARTGYEFGTIGSRSTMQTGNALRLACQDAKRQIFELASPKLNVPAEALETQAGIVYVRGAPERMVKISDLFTPLGFSLKGGELVGKGVYTGPSSGEDLATGQSKRPCMGYSYGAAAIEVAVNTETGEYKILRIADCFEMGQPVNPKICEGQIESGMAMGLGSATSEEAIMRQGKLMTPSFMDYKMPTAVDMPPNKNAETMIVTGHLHRDGPYGAKGFSEGVMVPQGPALANAIYNAVGVRIHDIPITKEKVLEALKKKNAGG